MKKSYTMNVTVFSAEEPLAVETRSAPVMTITHESGAYEGQATLWIGGKGDQGGHRLWLTRDDFRALLKVATEATQHCWGLE